MRGPPRVPRRTSRLRPRLRCCAEASRRPASVVASAVAAPAPSKSLRVIIKLLPPCWSADASLAASRWAATRCWRANPALEFFSADIDPVLNQLRPPCDYRSGAERIDCLPADCPEGAAPGRKTEGLQ